MWSMNYETLRQLWQGYATSSNLAIDQEEKRGYLIKLLDCCLVCFANESGEGGHQTLKTTRTYVGNWMIHQFIIHLNSRSSQSNNFTSDYDFLHNYFVNDDIGWKLLKSISLLKASDGLLYNLEFIKILLAILKSYLFNYSNIDDEFGVGVNDGLMFDVDLFLSETKVDEQSYLKTLKHDILTPAKVKLWIKSIRTRRKSNEDSDEEGSLPRHLIKCSNKLLLNFRLDQAKQKEITTNLLAFKLEEKTPAPYDIIMVIKKILIDYVIHEYKVTPFLMTNHHNDLRNTRLSVFIMAELSELLAKLLENESNAKHVHLMSSLKNLLVAYTLTVSVDPQGIEIMRHFQVFKALMKYLGAFELMMRPSLESGSEVNPLYRKEYVDTLCALVHMLIRLSQSLLYSQEFITLHSLLGELFRSHIESHLDFLLMIDEREGEYDSVRRLVDLLKQLQISVQHSHSLHLHKQMCNKKRHNRCDLLPLLAHHYFHHRLPFVRDSSRALQLPSTLEPKYCITSIVYQVLVKLILLSSKRSCDSTDKLICFISTHLSTLVSCCWSLRQYFRSLLYFAVNSTRSNLIRSAIFTIIEFSIKTQRKHAQNVAYQCNFCAYEEICGNEVPGDGEEVVESTSVPSEGYLTDNGGSSGEKSTGASHLRVELCAVSNCFLADLSRDYLKLLKSDNLATRQATASHLFNLFSYLGTMSKKSLLFHIILPIFQNHSEFAVDVCSFILRLFITLSDSSNSANIELNLVGILVKANALPVLKQLICPNMSLLHSTLKLSGDLADLPLTSIRLLGNCIKLELIMFKKSQLSGTSSNVESEHSQRSNYNALTTVPLLVDLFQELFRKCAKMSIINYSRFENTLFIKPASVVDYIAYYQKISFNVYDMDTKELFDLYYNLLCLFKLLTTCNNILYEFDLFRLILVHETFRFSERLYQFFQKLFKLVLNEIKLFRLVKYAKHENNILNRENLDVDPSKHVKFFNKLLKILQQLISVLLSLEPFYTESNFNNSTEIAQFIGSQLKDLVADDNLIRWNIPATSDPILDLLKMLTDIAFCTSDEFQFYSFHEIGEMVGLEELFIPYHPRTSSSDSLLSENELATSELNGYESDNLVGGYEADSECQCEPRQTNSGLTHPSSCAGGRSHQTVSSEKTPLLQHLDICQTVLDHLSQLLEQTRHLLDEAKLDSSQLKHGVNSTLAVINKITRNCRENFENSKILFENNFTSSLMKSFQCVLISSHLDDKTIKFALFELFIELSKVQLRPSELKLLIDLLKQPNADLEFHMSILHKLVFSRHWDLTRPQHCVRYPVVPRGREASLSSSQALDIYSTIAGLHSPRALTTGFESTCFTSHACVLPLSSLSCRYSISFWIFLDKIYPLIDKHQAYRHQFVDEESDVDIKENKITNRKLVHILSQVSAAGTIELWFDYLYNRFVYKLCKEKNGKLVYAGENFIANNSNILGNWNFVRINIDQGTGQKNYAQNVVKIAHSINCSKDKIVRLSYPGAMSAKMPSGHALLLGSSQAIFQFHYKLGNVFVFKEHLKSTTTIFLYSLGADFAHLHHLKSDKIVKKNYFVLPKVLVKDSSVDIISSMLQTTSSSLESAYLTENIILLYKASEPSQYMMFSNGEDKLISLAGLIKRVYVQHNSKHARWREGRQVCPVKMHVKLTPEVYYGIAKTVADSGGVSTFLFLLLILFDKCDNQAVLHKALELVLRIYDSHYYHRLMLDNHYDGYRVILHLLDKSRKSFSAVILKVFSQFSIHLQDNYSVILSDNIEIFLSSWKVWIRNLTTMKLFFESLNSLVDQSNPYRNFNLAQLQKANAFTSLLYMIEDIYVNFFGDYQHLDTESLEQVILMFKSLIDHSSDLLLLKSILNSLLLLQKTEWLHINQTQASFYYLFPSTVLVHSSEQVTSKANELSVEGVSVQDEPSESDSNLTLEDWEIISDLVDHSCQSGSTECRVTENVTHVPPLPAKSNADYATCKLIQLMDDFLGQIPHVATIDSIFTEISCLEFLVVLLNNPSDKVREMTLNVFFKVYQLYYNQLSLHLGSSSVDKALVGNLKKRTLYLLMASNQLYSYYATEELLNLCLAFLLNLDRNQISSLWLHDNNEFLVQSLIGIPLENFIPLLALLPRSIQSIGLCCQIVHLFYRIVRALTISQIRELQNEYGLVHSFSKLIINLNTQLVVSPEDQNKYNKEHVNEEINRILFEISMNYIRCNDTDCFSNWLDLSRYFSTIEHYSNSKVSYVFRQAQISILQGAFEAANQLQTLYLERRNSRGSISSVILNYQDWFQPEMLNEYSDSIEATPSQFHLTNLTHPKELVERFKLILKTTARFIMCRELGENVLSQKEKYFRREVLYHFLLLVERSQGLHLRPDQRRKEKNTWISLLNNSRSYFKKYLNRLFIFLISPFQNIDDRIFSLHLFLDKTKSLDLLRYYLDKSNEQFLNLFEAFLVDLKDTGVKEISIYSSSFNPSESGNHSFEQESIAMETVLTKLKEQTRSTVTEEKYKSEIANWCSVIESSKEKYEQGIVRYSTKLFSNMAVVYRKVVELASHLNDQVTVENHREQKQYLEHLKQEHVQQRTMRKRLLSLIAELIHHRGVWHLREHYPESWSLSPFESNYRVRKKLERCFLEIDTRYIRNDNSMSASKQLRSKSLFASMLEPTNLFSSFAVNELSQHLCEHDLSIVYTNTAKIILFDEEIEGEILITNNSIQFVSTHSSLLDKGISFNSKRAFFQDFIVHLNEIQELVKCRYELQHRAIEIFLTSGLTYLMAFESAKVRDECFHHLTTNRDLLPNQVESYNLVTLTQMWRERRITNFEYLMHLNKLSGRTFNDLMQYPVFPFVIADYKSDILDLTSSSSYRIMSRPIAVQKKEREKHYIDQYNYIKTENKEASNRDSNDINSFQFIVTSAPYHYGAHYSNSGIVLYYLVRLPPYTQMFLQYQDNNFDIPDRTFHSLYTTWRLATEDSTNGFKELIPEFFYLPEFLMNSENFNLGVRQNGERVHDVILPPWCRNNARLFTMINRQALESNYITHHLNQWIDLIFGYQQSGKAAVEAINVFHPATQFTADLTKIEDEVKRHALKTMIKTFGQMPSQLFTMPHPSISPDALLPIEDEPNSIANSPSMGEVIGLKWGTYVGSPIFPRPLVCFEKRFSHDIYQVCPLPTNDVIVLPRNASLLVCYSQQRRTSANTLYILSYSICTWSNLDSSIWFRGQEGQALFVHENSFLDKVCIVHSIPDYDIFLVGYCSGIIICYQLNNYRNEMETVELKTSPVYLVGHHSTVTSISMNKSFNIALSSDQSGVCILWDLNKQQYIRTVMDNDSESRPVVCSAISDTLGDLALVTQIHASDGKVQTSKLSAFTINGHLVGEVSTEVHLPYYTAVCYSTSPEGLSINVIATGLSNGFVKLWSSWDLTPVREIKSDHLMPIRSIAYSFNNDLLYIVSNDNRLFALENPPWAFPQSSNSNVNRKNFRILDLTHLT